MARAKAANRGLNARGAPAGSCARRAFRDIFQRDGTDQGFRRSGEEYARERRVRWGCPEWSLIDSSHFESEDLIIYESIHGVSIKF